MAVTTTKTNKPINPRGNDQSPKGYNRAALYSGKALDFDGVNDYVEVADNASLDFTTAMSAFCYMRVDSLSTGGAVEYAFSKYDYGNNNRSWLLGQNDNKLIAVISKNGFSGATNTKDRFSATFENTSDYYFVGFTFESNVLKLYVNGQEVSTSQTNDAEVNSIYSGSADVCVGSGQFNGGPVAFLDGNVANARAFNVALTAAQVADLYNNPEKIVPTGVSNTALKLWLPMMEGAGTTAYDGSGNGNHGTISGATYVNGVGSPVAQSAVIDWNKGVNTFQYSESFNNAYWTQSNTTTTADAIEAPSGELNADKIIATAVNGSHAVFVSISAVISSGTSYRYSFFAKAGEYTKAAIRIGGSGYGSQPMAVVNLLDGSIVSQQGFTSLAVTDYNDGWYKISGVYTATSSVAPNIQPIADGFVTTADNYTYTGDGTSGIYAWGASHIPASNDDVYIPTLSTAQTSPVLLPQGLTTGRDITGVNLFENVRKQGALNLDGNSWAEVHDNASLDISDAITLEAWVYWDTSDTIASGVFGKWTASNQCYLLYKTNVGNTVRFYINSSAVGYTSLTDGWHHIVGTYDRTNKRLYVDGAQVNFNAQVDAIATSSLPLEIGRYDQQPAYGYDDQIAQPRIYNRALTAEEVERNYNAGKNIYK